MPTTLRPTLKSDPLAWAAKTPFGILALLAAIAVLIPTASCHRLNAQEKEQWSASLARPLQTPFGVVLGNSYGSALYLDAPGLRLLVQGPGVGAYVSLDPDARRIGFKQIDAAGRQTPSEVDLASGKVRTLWKASPRVGQVSYAQDGTIAFTVDTTLVLLRGGEVFELELGTYANLCPISPDGRWAVYNTDDDQLWLLNLHTEQRRRFTDSRYGYVDPRWSPDSRAVLFSSLHGEMRVYDRATSATVTLGEGWGAVWSPDSRSIAFYRKEIQRGQLVNTDLFLIARDGTSMRSLTETPVRFELDPSFLPSGGALLYHTGPETSVQMLAVSTGGPSSDAVSKVSSLRADYAGEPMLRPALEVPDLPASVTMDIPYVHQVYDTPDWFNGHWACAPTQAIMVLAHYGVLPPWETVCSWPTRHVTAWGAYVAEPYQFRQTAYGFTAEDPSGILGRGGYGFMWTGSWSPHSRMAEYFRRHGATTEQTEGTAYATALGEVAAGYPLSMCVMLTGAGHLVLAHGIGAEPHTFIFNDPYGDKNRGYWNYLGKDVRYDWPGYNNGYQNLTGVAWCIATRFPAPAAADTLVDDLEFSGGFSMQTSAPASMGLWEDLNRGYAGHLWFATTREVGAGDVCAAEWRPSLPVAGTYEVAAYVALSNATSAAYRVYHSEGDTTVVLNQKAFSESWAPIGTFSFPAGQGGAVRLGDVSDSVGQEIVFDAVRWRLIQGPTTGIASGARPSGISGLLQNYPNPFNPVTTVRYTLAERSIVWVEIFDALGARVTTLVGGEREAGTHAVVWDAAGHPSGVYVCRLLARAPHHGALYSDSRKLLLLR